MAIPGGAGNLQGPWPRAGMGHGGMGGRGTLRCGKPHRGYSAATGGRVALLPETAVGATAESTLREKRTCEEGTCRSLLRSEEKLPSIEEILLSHLPALTLVVLRSGTWHMAGDLHEYVPGW